jgi:hypothetical protein
MNNSILTLPGALNGKINGMHTTIEKIERSEFLFTKLKCF